MTEKSIWTVSTEPSPNYEAEQAARSAVFEKIAPKGNWKEPIACWINEAEFAECNEAAIWFTGAPLKVIKKKKGGKVYVEAPGYYATIGA